MGDIALRGNKLTKGRGPHGHGPKPFLNRPGQAQGTHGGKAKGGRIGLKHGTKPWGTGPKPGTLEFLQHHTQTPKRKGKAVGGAIAKGIGALAKKFKKKKVYPETESLTHQVGPYVGDVGSEGKKGRPKVGKGRSPGRRSWRDREAGPRAGAKKGEKA